MGSYLFIYLFDYFFFTYLFYHQFTNFNKYIFIFIEDDLGVSLITCVDTEESYENTNSNSGGKTLYWQII